MWNDQINFVNMNKSIATNRFMAMDSRKELLNRCQRTEQITTMDFHISKLAAIVSITNQTEAKTRAYHLDSFQI